MKKLALFPLSFIFFYSCNSTEETAEKEIHEVEFDSSDTYHAIISDIEDDDTTTFFEFLESITVEFEQETKDDVAYMKNQMMNDFNAIQTAEELKEFYLKTVPATLTILEDIAWSYDGSPESDWSDWEKLNEKLPFFDAGSYEAEGNFGLVINAYPFYEKAQSTPSDHDDIYFEAVKRINNGFEELSNELIIIGYGGSYTFFEHYCDWCSNSLLGTGIFEYVLEITQNCSDSTNLFRAELYEIESQTLRSMSFDCYQESEEKVLAELEKIASTIKMPDDHMQVLYDVIDDIDNSEGITFDGECEWEEM